MDETQVDNFTQLSGRESSSEVDHSSATEGPDTPSPPSSPTLSQMESSPRYSVKFTDKISKDGDSIKYTISVRKLFSVSGEDAITLVREYEDIQYLDHQLHVFNKHPGIIFPPLPDKPSTDAAGAENSSRKQLGTSNREIIGDANQWRKDSKLLEKYIEMVVEHPILGKEKLLMTFLETVDPPIRPVKLKKGWLSGVKEKWDARIYSTKDCDDWFAKERCWASAYAYQIKDASEKLSNVVSAHLRLTQQLAHLSGALNISVAGNEGANAVYNKLNSGFSGCIDIIKNSVENEACEATSKLGSYLEMYSSYMDQENAMLLRRTGLMIEWENNCKLLEKARPNREEAAKLIRDEAEKEFSECSGVAKAEIKYFHGKRLAEFRQSLIAYVEGQMKCYNENQLAFSSCLAKMNKIMLPELEDSVFDPNDNEIN